MEERLKIKMKNKLLDMYKNGGVRVYIIVKENNKRKLMLMNCDGDVIDKLKDMMKFPFDNFLLELDNNLKEIHDVYDGTKSIYRVKEDIFNPFNFFEITNEIFNGVNPDGFAINVGYDDNTFWIYQNLYQSAIIRKENKLSLTYEDGFSYYSIKRDLLCLEKRIDAITR